MYENWMRDLPTVLHTIPFIYLAIPGSHDTMTYGITRNSNIAPDASTQVRYLSKIFGPLVRRLVYNWSVTQNLNVTEQLKFGIRYLDMRVSTSSKDESLHFVHAMYAGEVHSKLIEIKKFLDHHPSECVIIDFQHFYRFTTQNHVQLIQMIEDLFSEKLCVRPDPITNMTLKWMWSRGYQVILIYRDDIVFSIDRNKGFWSGTVWPTFWPDTTSISRLIQFCDGILEQRDKYFGFITQILITPDTKFVTKNLFSNLYDKCVRPCNAVMKPWIEKKQAGKQGVNVIIADFVSRDGFNFCSTVIKLNKKLADHLIGEESKQNVTSKTVEDSQNVLLTPIF